MGLLRMAGVCALLAAIGSTVVYGGAWKAAGGRAARGIPQWAAPKTPGNSHYLPDRIIIRVSDDPLSATGKADPRKAVTPQLQARSLERMFPASKARPAAPGADISGLYVLRYDAPIDPFTLASEISSAPGVEYAEPWFIYPLSEVRAYVPNDTNFNLQWYARRVRADSAWDVEKGDSNVVIGFVDTGVQEDHPDLQANIWFNPGEAGPDSADGLDNDANGKVDDWRGWDFGGASWEAPVEDNNPSPTATNNAHGTHVAGIACAVPDNNRGITGAGFHTRILAVKTTSDNDTRAGGLPYIIAGYQGIVYAAETGADIINLSWGGPGYAQAEQDIINYATSLGALIVAAAGNTGSPTELQYPASYDNVISVAATKDTLDQKANYSSYNERVDVTAPGGQGSSPSTGIYSTWYPSTYNSIYGTSMATPLAAGVAALIRAHFPSETPQQIGERLRVTCDDLYGVNSIYRYKLGRGRVNAWRALNESWPSVRMTAFTARDSLGGNDNGAFEVNEDVDISMDFTNFLDATSGGTTVSLSTTEPFISVTNGLFSPGAIPTGGSVSNSPNPYRIHVLPGIGPMKLVTFLLTISDGSYTDRQEFTLLFNPTFATHTVNNAWVTLTNNGRIGFQNFPTNTQGVGFVFGGSNQLFEGGLIVGTSSTKLVNVVRNVDGTQDADFASAIAYNLTGPGAVADEEGSTYYADSVAPASNRLNVRVSMNSYAYAAAPDDDYVITSYDIRNASGAQMTNLYAGVFLDWDVHAASGAVNTDSYFDSNKTAFDPSRGLAYAWYDTVPPTPYCGVVALEGAASYRSLHNSLSIDLSDAAKWAWISGGIVSDLSKGDVHHVVSSGPYTLENGASAKVGFALVGGNSLTELQANADAAVAKWAVIKSLTDVEEEPSPGIPAAFGLEQNYPNPFNPSTTIRYAIPSAGSVRLTVYSVLGGKVRTLIGGAETGAGYHQVVWDGLDDMGREAASGVYVYRMEYTGAGDALRSLSRKFILLR